MRWPCVSLLFSAAHARCARLFSCLAELRAAQAAAADAVRQGMPARMLKSLQRKEATAKAALEAATANAHKALHTGGEGSAERADGKDSARAAMERALTLADEWASHGSVLFVTVDAQVAAVLLMADALKPEAAKTVDALKALGVRPVLLTGDKMTSAQRVARAGALCHLPGLVGPPRCCCLGVLVSWYAAVLLFSLC